MFSFKQPHKIAAEYAAGVAYFCMEYAIDQSLKLYAGGLGFLAGSHLKSAYELHQNMVAIGILWKYGYYDQQRNDDQTMSVQFQEKIYGLLEKTDISFTISIGNKNVHVVVWYLQPDTFKTAPLFLLSTDTPENDFEAQKISHKLYDSDVQTKLAAGMLLGIGGARLLELLNWTPKVYHLNEAHALPLAFYLYQKHQQLDALRNHIVFTNHTPEPSGMEKVTIQVLRKLNFFSELSFNDVLTIARFENDLLLFNDTALNCSRIANAVSKNHLKTMQRMWPRATEHCKLISITNAQNFNFWADNGLYKACWSNDSKAIQVKKRQRKLRLFEEVADQNGELYDVRVLTIVFAKRFAGYKRAELLFQDMNRFHKLVTSKKYPVQLIWAGKPYPADAEAIASFNRVIRLFKAYPNCSVLVGYELKLSKLLKQGADVWLNMPRIGHEASGTSGMTAAMNGAVNVSITDGWFSEFAQHATNSFVIPSSEARLPDHEQDREDANSLYDLLESVVIPTYYEQPDKWIQVMKNSMETIIPEFDSNRLADDYYKKMYAPETAKMMVEVPGQQVPDRKKTSDI